MTVFACQFFCGTCVGGGVHLDRVLGHAFLCVRLWVFVTFVALGNMAGMAEPARRKGEGDGMVRGRARGGKGSL